MDGEGLKILGSQIERYCSKQRRSRIGLVFWVGFLTRQGLVLATGGLLTVGLDRINLTGLELVPTLFGFLTTGFLAGLDRVFFWAWGSWEVNRCVLKVRVLDRQSMIGLCASNQGRLRMTGWWRVEMMLRTIFSTCLLIQSSKGVVSCVIASEAMVLPSITSIGTGVDFLTTWMLCRATNVWSMKEEVALKSTNADTCGISSGIRMMSTC